MRFMIKKLIKEKKGLFCSRKEIWKKKGVFAHLAFICLIRNASAQITVKYQSLIRFPFPSLTNSLH